MAGAGPVPQTKSLQPGAYTLPAVVLVGKASVDSGLRPPKPVVTALDSVHCQGWLMFGDQLGIRR